MTLPRFLQALWPRTRISTHLLFFFMCISLIPCGVLTALTLLISARSLEKSVRQTLMAISDAKHTQLEVFIRERRGDLIVLGRSPSVMEATRQLADLRRREPPDSPAYACGIPTRTPRPPELRRDLWLQECHALRPRR